MLETIQEIASAGRLSYHQVIKGTARRLGLAMAGGSNSEEVGQAILTCWHDLMRTGLIAWGHDLMNLDPPNCHLTERGRAVLKHLSRDPSNPDGYLEHLRSRAALSPMAAGYVDEALQAYQSACFKAAAVMIGAASECLVLELRDALVTKLKALGKTPPKKLEGWQVKQVLDALQQLIQAAAGGMPAKLREAFGANWPAFVQQIRAARNDAGHPSSIDPITPETVHAALLIFPELAGLAAELKTWVVDSYS
jgi:hypothetical protein